MSSGSLNWAAIIISVTTILVLVLNNEVLKPRLAKFSRIPVPIELIVVVSGTLIAKYSPIITTWNITVIGEIPIGFPGNLIASLTAVAAYLLNTTLFIALAAPRYELMSDMLLSGFTIAMVSYTVSVSMALIFAKKSNYDIDFNQELLAMGGANVVGSFFSCFPLAASLSRSTIQETVGGRTQLASLISCAILTFVLLWIGPFFEVLPKVRLNKMSSRRVETDFIFFLVCPFSYYCSRFEGNVAPDKGFY